MGGIAKGFSRAAGALLGVKRPKVPEVEAPPTIEETTAQSTEVDEATRLALLDQQALQGISQQRQRSLEGTGAADRTAANQIVERSAQRLQERDEQQLLDIQTAERQQRDAAAAAERERMARARTFRSQSNARSRSSIARRR